MSSEDQLKEPIWKVVLTIKPLRLFVQGIFILTFLVGAWTLTKPAFEYAKSKFNYVFAIKPENKLLKQDKYSFWAGYTLSQSIHPSSNREEFVRSFFSDRNKLLKSFEVLGFEGKDASFNSDSATYNFAEQMAKNYELKDRLEGYLESRSNGNLELYKAGFSLASLINELQASDVDVAKVQDLVKMFTMYWSKAQDALDYRLTNVELSYSENDYFIYSQPRLIENAINTLEAIRHFYGPI